MIKLTHHSKIKTLSRLTFKKKESFTKTDMSAQGLIPVAFWNALNNQNVTQFGTPQWSIVVNDSGIQCSIFFENQKTPKISRKRTYSETKSKTETMVEGRSVSSSRSSRDEVSPIKSRHSNESEITPTKIRDEKDSDSEEEINPIDQPVTDSKLTDAMKLQMLPNQTASTMAHLPLIQQFFVQQLQNHQLQQKHNAVAATVASEVSPPAIQNYSNHMTSLAGRNEISPSSGINGSSAVDVSNQETPVPGDLMLIPNENRRRLINLREEATANRLSVTAFIRRGALLYFDSDELAVNRLHTLDQHKLHALELETKFYFGEVPQQLFRRTIAIQQSQIRSKKSTTASTTDRERLTARNSRANFGPSFQINPNLFANMTTLANTAVGNAVSQSESDLIQSAPALGTHSVQIPTSTTLSTVVKQES